MDFEDSVAALTAKEALKIEHALLELEGQLTVPVPEKEPASVEEPKEHDVYRDYMQSAQVGYSAHTEEVTDEEISMWQYQFPYLQIRGQGMLELDPDYEEVNEEELPEGTSFQPMPKKTHQGDEENNETLKVDKNETVDLRIIGMVASLFPESRGDRGHDTTALQEQEEHEEEIFFTEGVLEEPLHIDRTPTTVKPGNSATGEDIYTSIEPMQCQQAEVVNSLVDIIFPDIVKSALRPLVVNVVRAGREHNVQFVAEEELPHERGDEDDHGDGCMFFSNEGPDEYRYDSNDGDYSSDHDRGGGGGFLVAPDCWD